MRLVKSANTYIKKVDVFDMALLKLCLFSGGVALGASIPKKNTKSIVKFSFLVFITSYCIAITKFVCKIMCNDADKLEKECD